MRFGRRKKNRGSVIRRVALDRSTTALAEAPDGFQDEGIAIEERGALLNREPEDDVMASLAENEPVVAGDPTQRLLTALGRFQRQVSKAEQGGPQESWCDECMNQIVTGIEVSIAEEWDNVQEALTDTARVLQTYEYAGRASECVNLLQDSYEILCLMVGDLIVDNVRSGVMQKWHERYEAATAEVAKAGLALVSDDAQEESTSTPSSQVEVEVPESSVPFDVPGAVDADLDEHAVEETVVEETVVEEAVAEEPDADDFAAPEPPQKEAPDDFQDAASPFESSEDSADDSPDTSNLPSMNELINMQARVTGQLEDEQEDIFGIGPGKDQEAAAIDSLHDIDLLAPIENSPTDKEVILPFEEPPSIESDARTDDIDLQDNTADVDDDDFYTPKDIDDVEVTNLDLDTATAQDEPATEVIAKLPTEPEATEDIQEFTNIEPFKFGPETVEKVQEITETEHVEEKPETLEEVQESVDIEPVEAEQPSEAEPIVFEPGSPEALLQTAQEAMARGDVSDAKTIALELAASMARLEVERAEAKVADSEQQLRVNEEAISTAEARVSDYEETLSQAEVFVAEHQTLFQEKHGLVEDVQNQVQAAVESVSDLDAQIATLQKHRSDEAEGLGQLESTLDEKQAEESRAQSELDDMITEEQSAQDRSDQARDEVEKLKEAQTEHKSTIRETRAEFTHRQESVDEIVDTIEHVTGSKHKPTDEGNMLF